MRFRSSARYGSFILVNWEATKDNEHLFIGTNYREIKKTVRMLSQIYHLQINPRMCFFHFKYFSGVYFLSKDDVGEPYIHLPNHTWGLHLAASTRVNEVRKRKKSPV